MMIFDGSAGSFKTTATAAIKRIVDPSGREKEDNVSTMQEKQDDLIIQLNNRYLSSFDNVSSISPRTSDVLCRAITGSSNPKRKLYTDDDESIQTFKRKIILNGIVPPLEYPDLQTRLLSYARERINDSDRLTEREFNEKLNTLLPFVIGKIFITLCQAMRNYSQLKNTMRPKTRMSDFEVWGEIISRCLGNEKNRFLEVYYDKLNEGNISSHDAYPIVSSIQSFMDGKEEYENTASSLFNHLVRIAEDQGVDLRSKYVRFPKSPHYLKKELVIVESIIRGIGFDIEKYHYTKNDGKFTKNSSIIRITRRKTLHSLDNPQMSSPFSPSSPHTDLGTKIGEDISEDIIDVNDTSSPEKVNFRHKTKISGDSEDGEDIPENVTGNTNSASENTIGHLCKCSCGATFHENSIAYKGVTIREVHEKKLGHNVKFQVDDNIKE